MLVKGVPGHEEQMVLICFDDEEVFVRKMRCFGRRTVSSQMGIELSNQNEAFPTSPITTYSGDRDI